VFFLGPPTLHVASVRLRLPPHRLLLEKQKIVCGGVVWSIGEDGSKDLDPHTLLFFKLLECFLLQLAFSLP
jgi:hypothetical protein